MVRRFCVKKIARQNGSFLLRKASQKLQSPAGIAYLTELFNLSLASLTIPSVISYRPLSLLSPVVKTLEALISEVPKQHDRHPRKSNLQGPQRTPTLPAHRPHGIGLAMGLRYVVASPYAHRYPKHNDSGRTSSSSETARPGTGR